MKDLQNFHDLIGQRITQQNNGSLLQLKTKIYYSDESSVTLSSYNELVTYNEIKPIVSVAARMTWVYLIQFSDKDIPEKQEIEIMTIASPLRSIIEDDDIPVFYSGFGQFEITIKHTARSWGADIESLISNQINSILIPATGWKKFIRQRSTIIGFLTGVAFLLCSTLGIYYSTSRFNATEIARVSKFLIKADSVEKKADFTLKYIAENAQNFFFLKTQLFTTFSLFLAIILGAWVSNLADNEERSHLILTREAKRSRDFYVEKSKRKTLWFLSH